MKLSDAQILQEIQTKVGQPFHYVMEGERCVELDLTSEKHIFHGLIRVHSEREKQEILDLVCRLTELRKLNLLRNRLLSLPEAFGQLTNLEVLNLGSNYLGKTPAQIRGFKRLKYLQLGNNDLPETPAFLGELKDLEYIGLHKNVRIKNIEPLAGLKKVKSLNLYLVTLSRTPDFLYRWNGMTNLVLWNTKDLTDDISELQNLEYLTICGGPGLRRLPDGLTQLKKLRMARLYQNSLEALPQSIGELESLEQLSLYQNLLSSLPNSFARLQKLKKLNLGWNQFENVPACLDKIKDLEWVGLFNNPLQASTIPRFSRQTKVDIDWPFTTLPDQDTHLEAIKKPQGGAFTPNQQVSQTLAISGGREL